MGVADRDACNVRDEIASAHGRLPLQVIGARAVGRGLWLAASGAWRCCNAHTDRVRRTTSFTAMSKSGHNGFAFCAPHCPRRLWTLCHVHSAKEPILLKLYDLKPKVT